MLLTKRLPVVMSTAEVARVLAAMHGPNQLAAQLQYGCGCRVGEVVDSARLSNAVSVSIDTQRATLEPCVAPIYQLDGLVRRASSLQLTADARAGVAA
jgi:hypothetical protein